MDILCKTALGSQSLCFYGKFGNKEYDLNSKNTITVNSTDTDRHCIFDD